MEAEAKPSLPCHKQVHDSPKPGLNTSLTLVPGSNPCHSNKTNFQELSTLFVTLKI